MCASAAPLIFLPYVAERDVSAIRRTKWHDVRIEAIDLRRNRVENPAVVLGSPARHLTDSFDLQPVFSTFGVLFKSRNAGAHHLHSGVPRPRHKKTAIVPYLRIALLRDRAVRITSPAAQDTCRRCPAIQSPRACISLRRPGPPVCLPRMICRRACRAFGPALSPWRWHRRF